MEELNKTKENNTNKNEGKPLAKRMRPNDDDETGGDETEVVDLCEQLKLKAGNCLEVEWHIDVGEKTVPKWWGCTLLPFDGETTTDGVAVRVLDYDEYPEGGFPERSQEKVVFLNDNILFSPETQGEFRYRPEDGIVTFGGNEKTAEAINVIMMEAFNKQYKAFNELDRPSQGRIADAFARKNEELVDAIVSQPNGRIIGRDDMQEICRGVFGKK